jgi:hypothetical protein
MPQTRALRAHETLYLWIYYSDCGPWTFVCRQPVVVVVAVRAVQLRILFEAGRWPIRETYSYRLTRLSFHLLQ